MTDAFMTQTAPYPEVLAELVRTHRFRPGYVLKLEDSDRGQGCKGLTLYVRTAEVNTYDRDKPRPIWHLFPVPAAAYNRRSWLRWLFEQCALVTRHEDGEWFAEVDPDNPEVIITRPFAPLHGPGNDPYVVHELATDTERRTLQDGTLSERSP